MARVVVTTCDVGVPAAVVSDAYEAAARSIHGGGCRGIYHGEPRAAVLGGWRPLPGGKKHACPHCAPTVQAEPRGPKQDWSAEVREVYAYLQERTGKRHVLTGQSQGGRFIALLLASGFTVEDCKTAVDRCYQAWKGVPKMEPYIRATTIFRPTKFPGYLDGSELSHHGDTRGGAQRDDWMERDG